MSIRHKGNINGLREGVQADEETVVRISLRLFLCYFKSFVSCSSLLSYILGSDRHNDISQASPLLSLATGPSQICHVDFCPQYSSLIYIPSQFDLFPLSNLKPLIFWNSTIGYFPPMHHKAALLESGRFS